MQEIKVPAGFTVSSYEKDGRFVLVFAGSANPNPTTDHRSIAVTMAPETLTNLADYFQETED